MDTTLKSERCNAVEAYLLRPVTYSGQSALLWAGIWRPRFFLSCDMVLRDLAPCPFSPKWFSLEPKGKICNNNSNSYFTTLILSLILCIMRNKLTTLRRYTSGGSGISLPFPSGCLAQTWLSSYAVVNFMCQLCWAKVPRYLVQHARCCQWVFFR